jgi:hypothetical protein
MHITNPLGIGPVGVFLLQVEVLSYLVPDVHYNFISETMYASESSKAS